MYFNFSPDSQELFDGGVACLVISIVAVLLRVFCKIRYKQGIHADDVFIIAGALFNAATFTVVTWGR
jgi:hypothetical protein